MVQIEKIRPNPRQPRVAFDPEKLAELASSIAEHGVLQPILVTADPSTAGEYILLAGERRLRASQLAGRTDIPARIVEASDVEQLEFALIENVQRDDLNPIEEARAYEALVNSFGYTQDEVAKRVAKSRVAIVNTLRLLRLTSNCIDDLEHRRMSAGHARAVLMLPHPLQQEMLRREILERELTVRQAEARARRILQGDVGAPEDGTKKGDGGGPKSSGDEQQDLDVVALQERLTLRLGCRVSITTRSGHSGSIQVQYNSLDDLGRILEALGISMDD
jgi:ParB family chromosome partitioning protein